MSEVTFAKSFLATLDKRPIKLPADHVTDARKYPNQSPFTLPKQTHPFPSRTGPTATQQAKSKTITATLKPMRSTSTSENVTLSDITLDTTIHELKTQYAQRTGQAQDKIKVLLNKKPAADLKTLKELGVSEDVELSVMIMGGGGAVTPTPAAGEAGGEKVAVPEVPAGDKMEVDSQGPAPLSEKAQAEADKGVGSGATAGQEETAQSILQTEEFWADLKGFLAQRLKDQGEGERLAGMFREACGRR